MKRSAKKCVAGLIALVAGICILPASVPAYTLNHVRVDTDLWYRPNSAFYAGSRDAMRTAMRTGMCIFQKADAFVLITLLTA